MWKRKKNDKTFVVVKVWSKKQKALCRRKVLSKKEVKKK